MVYTGDHGGKWVEYPDGWPSTYTDGKPGYQPAQVLSVHDGVLDFYLHNVNGLPSGANPSPLVTGSSQYQTYGRYTARIKSDTIPNYHAAWLLWPVQRQERRLRRERLPGDQPGQRHGHGLRPQLPPSARITASKTSSTAQTRIDDGAWHTYTQEWGPGFRKYYIDGQPCSAHSTTRVWSQERALAAADRARRRRQHRRTTCWSTG